MLHLIEHFQDEVSSTSKKGEYVQGGGEGRENQISELDDDAWKEVSG